VYAYLSAVLHALQVMLTVLVCSPAWLFAMQLLRLDSYHMIPDPCHLAVMQQCITSAVAAESVVVLKGVGVLLVTQQRWGGSSSRFLDSQDIHSVFIHEVIMQQQQQQQQQQGGSSVSSSSSSAAALAAAASVLCLTMTCQMVAMPPHACIGTYQHYLP
jgi:hypothetical protein